jgi:hypothetical protein
MSAEPAQQPIPGVLEKLVQRYGATPVAAATSLVFALPLAAWAGAVDLYPRPAVWATGTAGLVLVVPWVLVARRAFALQARRPVRTRRFEWHQMSRAEKKWAALSAAGAIGIVGWLNAAATVDLPALGPGLAAGRPSIYAFVVAALAALALLAALSWYGWRRNRRAFGLRAQASAPEPDTGGRQ